MRQHGSARSALWKLLAVLLAFSLLAAACGDDDDDTTTGVTDDGVTDDGTADDADDGALDDGALDDGAVDDGTDDEVATGRCEATVAGTRVNYGQFSPSGPLEPTGTSGSLVGGTELLALYDVLLRYNNETGEYEPQLAESLTPNDDFTEWTLVLREGLTYSNGDPFDIENLFAHLERFFREGARNSSAAFLSLIESQEEIDERTAVFTLRQPWSTFQYVFADEPGMVVNARVIPEDADELAVWSEQPPAEAGMGPYQVTRNAAGEELVMTARDDYWGGPVCIETLRFVFLSGANNTYQAFQAGDINVGFLRDANVFARAESNGEVLLTDLQDSGGVLLMNHREGSPTSDPRIREAIALAVNEESISERAFGGDFKTTRSLFHPDSGYWSEGLDEAEYDPERAAQLVEEAKADGFDGRIRVGAPETPPGPEVVIAVEGMLEAVGFEVEQMVMPQLDIIGRVVQGDFDVVNWGFSLGSAEAFTQLLFNFTSTSPTNRMGYGSDDMDAAVDAVLAAATPEERVEAMAEVNRIFQRDFVGFNYGSLDVGIVVAPEVKGVKQTGTVMYMFDDAYIEE